MTDFTHRTEGDQIVVFTTTTEEDEVFRGETKADFTRAISNLNEKKTNYNDKVDAKIAALTAARDVAPEKLDR